MWRYSMRQRVVRAGAFRYMVFALGFAAPLGGGAGDARAQCYSGTGQTYQAGPQANAVALYSTAVGYGATALCENSVALGHNAQAAGGPGGATALGASAQVNGANSMALGLWARAFADNAMALGSGAYVTAEGAIAFGGGANAHYQNSVAFGNGVAATAQNQFRLGAAYHTYTLTGIASASSSAAQTGDYRYMVTSDEFGNLAVAAIPLSQQGDVGAVEAAHERADEAHVGAEAAKTRADEAYKKSEEAVQKGNEAKLTADGALQRSGGVMTGGIDMGDHRIANVGDPIDPGDAANKRYVDGRVDQLAGQLGAITTRLDQHAEGIAMAMAMGGGIVLPAGKTFAVGANVGYYDDKQAFAAQALVRVGNVLTFNTAVGMGLDDQSNIGARAGFMAAW